MAEHKPRRELLTIWRLYLVVCALVPAFAVSLFFTVGGFWWLLLSGVWVTVFLGLYAVYFPLLYRNKSFSLEQDRVMARGGAVYRYAHALPISTIQYVSLTSGPFQRMFRICSVVIVAPGGRMVLSGLPRSTAESLASVLTEAISGR